MMGWNEDIHFLSVEMFRAAPVLSNVPKPLKQYALFKKDDPFRSSFNYL